MTYRESGERLNFSSGGILTSRADRNGLTESYAYNAAGGLASVTDTAGRVTTMTWTSGRITKITDPAGRVTNYTYDTSSRLAGVEDPDGGDTTYGYDSTGRLSSITTPEGKVTTFTYASTHRVQTVRRVLAGTDAAVTTYAYATGSTTQTNPRGKSSTYTLDSAGRITKTTDALGRARSQTWTASSDIATVVDAMGVGATPGNSTTYSYDTLGNRTAVALPTGAASRVAYGASSTCATTDTIHAYQAKCLTDAAGNEQTLTYDTPGNVVSARDTTNADTGGVQLSYTYHGTAGAACGAKTGQRCSATDGKGATTSYSYDTAGNLKKVTPPAPLGATTYTYDSIGRVQSVTDGKGQTSTYVYDALDRLLSVTYQDSSSVAYGYDGDGNRLTETDSAAGVGTYTYDALGRQTSESTPGMPTPATLAYDKVGNLTSYTDSQGTVGYAYDDANQLTSITEPGGSCTTTPTTKCISYTYDSNAALATTTFPGGVVRTVTRDAAGRETKIKAVKGSSVITELDTAAGGTGPTADRDKVQSRTEFPVPGANDPVQTTYAYDSLSRLTLAEELRPGSVFRSWDYTHDGAGNLTGLTTLTFNDTYNAADQLTSFSGSPTPFTYDANGNELSAPSNGNTSDRETTVNARDQISRMEMGPANVDMNYFGTTNDQRTSAGSLHTYTNSPLGLATNTRGSTVKAFTRTPSGDPVSIRQAGATTNYYLTDNLGSVIALTSPTGTQVASYRYDPTGVLISITGGSYADTQPLRYIGAGYLDQSSNTYKLGVRYYDPKLGRFTQPDPTGQEANSYLYAGGDSINNADPTGAASGACIAIGAAIGVSALSTGGWISGRSGGDDARWCGNSSRHNAGT